MRKMGLSALQVSTIIATAGTLLAACGGSDSGDTQTTSAVDAQTTSATTDLADAPALRDTFEGRSYLPDVLPNASNLNGYAGYILNVFGTKDNNGICIQSPNQAPTLDPISYVKAGKQPLTEPVGDIITNIVVRKGGTGTGGFLSFVSVGLTDSMRAEVVVEDVARQTVTDILDKPRLRQLAQTAARQGVCAREIVLIAQLTSFKTRTYRELEKKAKLAGYGLAVDGKLFGSASSFNNKYRLFIESRPIDAYGGPSPTPDTASSNPGKRLKFLFPRIQAVNRP